MIGWKQKSIEQLYLFVSWWAVICRKDAQNQLPFLFIGNERGKVVIFTHGCQYSNTVQIGDDNRENP